MRCDFSFHHQTPETFPGNSSAFLEVAALPQIGNLAPKAPVPWLLRCRALVAVVPPARSARSWRTWRTLSTDKLSPGSAHRQCALPLIMVKSQGGERVFTTPHSYLRNKVLAYESFYLLCPLIRDSLCSLCARAYTRHTPQCAREPVLPVHESLYSLYVRAYSLYPLLRARVYYTLCDVRELIILIYKSL